MHTRKRGYLLLVTALLVSTMAAARSVGLAQSETADWQTLRPEGEEFTILMPKDPKFEEGSEPYHRDMTLNTRLYLATTPAGPVLAVVSLSGIKAAGAGANESLRLNSYVDAFKNWFPQKVSGKDAIAKLTLAGEKNLNGNVGREYRVVIGNLAGTARVFTTRRRFYAAVILNAKKDDGRLRQSPRLAPSASCHRTARRRLKRMPTWPRRPMPAKAPPKQKLTSPSLVNPPLRAPSRARRRQSPEEC